MSIPILYHDEHLIVVHKPSGLLVHRSLIDKYETEFLIQTLRDQIGQYVYSVHRLDKPTSGLIIMALNADIARSLSKQFEQHSIIKKYVALARGYVKEPVTIDYPLRESVDKMTDEKAETRQAKSAVSDVTPIARFELPYPVARYQSARFSLLELCPRTGRKHQLRRHLAHIRHPIVGDTTHGDGRQNRYAAQHIGITRLALCASNITFKHPVSDTRINVSTRLDQNLDGIKQLLEQSCTFKSANYDWHDLI